MSENATKRTYYLAAIAIVAIVLISAVATARPLTIQPANTIPQVKTLQVTGEGTVSAMPDEAILLLAVQTQATTAGQASSDNAATMSSVIAALTNVGVSKTAIQTTSYSLAPIYESNPVETTPAKIVGYTALNAIQVTITDFSLVGKVLDTAIAAGVNEVQGVIFTLSTSANANFQNQALQLAIQDANSKAKSVASSLGVSLIGPIAVTPGYTVQPFFDRLAASAAQTPIQAGPLQVTADVQITYQIA